MFGAADVLREAIGHPVTPLKQINYDYAGYLAPRTGLGETAFEAAWTEGRAMSPEQAIEYALSTEEPAPPATSEPRRPRTDKPADVLTRREQQVALLVARGLPNRRIAEDLEITERTVETHVGKVLRKLRLRSRTQIATWIIEQGPPAGDPN